MYVYLAISPSGNCRNYPHLNVTGVKVMENTSLAIIVPHLFSPISAFNAESKSYIISLRFNVHETLQINKSNFQVFNNACVRFL